jgi:hypothetical protein
LAKAPKVRRKLCIEVAFRVLNLDAASMPVAMTAIERRIANSFLRSGQDRKPACKLIDGPG